MELWKIIVLSVLGTLLLVWLLYVICSTISDAKERKKRREEWYMNTLMKAMKRLDEIDIELDYIRDVTLILNEEICDMKEKKHEKFNRQNSNR